MMRVAHITDLHVEVPPAVQELFSKRLIGATNLYILGRKDHFSLDTVSALVRKVVELAPDLVVCTGDLTAMASEAEFLKAREMLAPILDRFPFFVIPGNHDVYTGESVGRFGRHFGEWSGNKRSFGGLDWLALDVCHPDWMSRGRAGSALAELKANLDEGEDPVVVLLHYPLRNRRGERYGPFTRALSDAEGVEELLAHPRVRMVLHGHEHHGFRTTVHLGGRDVPIFDPGASGYAYLPDRRRTAHFNLYQIDPSALNSIDRYTYDGNSFSAEPGGAYASGR